MSTFPDYYSLLGISQNATPDEIRQAYKRESLRTHPDRLVNASPEERRGATEKFQAVADAYYVLSDPKRKREYDMQWGRRPTGDKTPNPDASANFFANFANMFGGAAAGMGSQAGTGTSSAGPMPAGAGFGPRPDADATFGDVFEELLRPEVNRRVPWWSYFGAVSGAGLGYIIANLPGLVAGGVAGNRLGAIRDAKGKSVAAVFGDLGGDQKAQILKALALKVLGTAF